MLGDLYRSESDLARARKAYGDAIGVDPKWYPAVNGMRELDKVWGTGVTVGPRVKLGEDFEFTAAYFRYDIPGDFTTYSGEGFKVGLVWRF